jgi:hypothetical protein
MTDGVIISHFNSNANIPETGFVFPQQRGFIWHHGYINNGEGLWTRKLHLIFASLFPSLYIGLITLYKDT